MFNLPGTGRPGLQKPVKGEEDMQEEKNSHIASDNAPDKESHEKEIPAGDEADGLNEIQFQVSRTALIYRYCFLLILTLIGSGILYFLVPIALSSMDYPVLVLLVVWVLALLHYWYYLLNMPYRISCVEEKTLSFISILRRREIPLNEITCLRVSPIYPTYLKICTSRKKNISIINHVNGLHDLVWKIKNINPDLETIGC